MLEWCIGGEGIDQGGNGIKSIQRGARYRSHSLVAVAGQGKDLYKCLRGETGVVSCMMELINIPSPSLS